MSRRAALTVLAVLVVVGVLYQVASRVRSGSRNPPLTAPYGPWTSSESKSGSSEPPIAEWFSIVPATRLVPNSPSLSATGPSARRFAGASVAPAPPALSTHELFHGDLLGAAVQSVPGASVSAQQQMLADLNTTRAQKRLPTLKLDRRLSRVALAHARDMIQHGFFAHESSNGDSPFERMRKARIAYVWAGENLAESPDEQTAYAALLNSREHFANIVQRHYSKVGIAAVQGPGGEIFFVEDFTS